MLASFNLVIVVIFMYISLLLAIEKGYTNAYVIPFFYFPFSIILPFIMFILAFLCGDYKKEKFKLIINGLILIFYPLIQNNLYALYGLKKMKKGQQNEQQNNNNVVVV